MAVRINASSVEFESTTLLKKSAADHAKASQQLIATGFRPVSIDFHDSQTIATPDTAKISSIDDVTYLSIWHRPLIADEQKMSLARRQANAAAALARLGQREEIFPALRITDDPESLTQFVHRCRDECLDVADKSRQALAGDARRIEDHVLFGLLLALGEFTLEQLPSKQKQPTVERVSDWFRDDRSAAIHGATGWLLRQWGQHDAVRRVDETPRSYDPNREWFSLVIDTGKQRFFQTYIVVPPGEYEIGSPANQRGHESNETLHRVRLTQPVAILDREVTRDEFDAWVHWNAGQFSPTGEHSMVGPSWYDGVQYCRWLTEKVGLSEADQAYADPNSLDKSQYPLDGDTDFPKNWPLKLDARGFRLPTVAEWEIAVRAGMRAKYGFGGDDRLLDRYAWLNTNSIDRQTQIAKKLRPNFRGLFDMHGNAYEWCHDWYTDYPLGNISSDPVGSTTGSVRVNRGGSQSASAVYCRSALRSHSNPTRRSQNNGLRLALVPSEEKNQ